jgi:DNA-binding CsgD family transcriptional regulator/tetratricopeptide (TPR) repeat protein
MSRRFASQGGRSLLCATLIGREPDLDEIRAVLSRLGDGEGSAVFVQGEAGVGKSRLVREGVAEARRARCSVLVGRAVQGQAAVAFRPIAEALNAYFRDQGPPDLPELDPFRPILATLVPEWRNGDRAGVDDSVVLLAEAVLRLLHGLGQRSAGCVLVLEDLQWADPETLSIVEYLAENLASEPVMCLSTLRSEPSPALGLVRRLSAGRAASVIDLRRLDPADVTAIACACLATTELPGPVAELLSAHADGLPFFVEELLAGAAGSGALVRDGDGWTVAGPLEAGVPDSFVDSVDRRLVALGDAAPAVVAAAAIGRSFDWALLPAITGLGDPAVLAALRAAVDAQLLVADPSGGGSFRFRHALTRDAVVGRLLPVERAVLSRRALDALEATHPGLPGETCELAAELAERAGDRPRAATFLIESGRRSLARGALASAEAAFGRAGDLAECPGVAAEAAEALCEALSLAGNTDRALDVGRELAGALEALDAAPGRRGDLELRLARAAATACRWDLADDHLTRGRAWAEKAGDDALAARFDAIAAHVAYGRGDIERSGGLARSALAEAERLELPDLTCEAWEAIGRCARTDDIEGAEEAFERANAVAEDHALTVWRIRALSELATVDILRLRPRDRLLATRELAMASGALATAAHLDFLLGIWFLDHWDQERAIEAARRSGGIARRFRLQQLLGMALVMEAAAWGRLSRRDDMEACIEEALGQVGDDPGACGVAWGTARAMFWLIGEDRRRGLAALEEAMAHFRRAVSVPAPERGLWALLRMIADHDGEAACAEVRASGATCHRLNLALLTLADAVGLGRSGRREEAEQAFAAGDAALASLPWRHFARRLVAEAAIADGWGDPVGWMREALPVFEAEGHDRLAAAARSLLQKAGAPMPRRRQDDQVPPGLREFGVTRRELEVLTLLADGLANKEIAARLYMSPRTVERHVANLTTKTGLRTRSELIAFAARKAPAPA